MVKYANGPPETSGGTAMNGTNGANGTNGTNGTNGIDGQPGIQGVAGPTGATGTTGNPGTNGTNGTNGINGAAGSDGMNGADGVNASAGVHATMWHDESTVITGSAIVPSVDGGSFYSMDVYQTPAAINDTFEQTFCIQAGSYVLYVMGNRTTANRGIVSWYLDGAFQGVQDWGTADDAHTILSLNVTTGSGTSHILRGVITGSSTGDWYMDLQKYWIK
jgi:collagen triple helix repeat protein